MNEIHMPGDGNNTPEGTELLEHNETVDHKGRVSPHLLTDRQMLEEILVNLRVATDALEAFNQLKPGDIAKMFFGRK